MGERYTCIIHSKPIHSLDELKELTEDVTLLTLEEAFPELDSPEKPEPDTEGEHHAP